ncbi:MAG: hypothetical protein AMS21_07090 [Gemmatimonas sp. SG8_38_2]|nr:MAG: hypothetical protein AMS21_07090 [Gemmatimonas sp. SG8_38_2]
MPDFRIAAGKAGTAGQPEALSLVEALIHRANDIANRYKLVESNLPYRNIGERPLEEDVSALSAYIAAATWKRIGDEVPSYAFAEKIGRRFRDAGKPVGALLLHWQIFRRAIHLVLADERIRTGQGGEDKLRQATLMNYTLDWATEASLVGFVISGHADGEPSGSHD